MEIILGTVLGIPVAWFFYWRSQRRSDFCLREHGRQLEARQVERERVAEERHRQLRQMLVTNEVGDAKSGRAETSPGRRSQANKQATAPQKPSHTDTRPKRATATAKPVVHTVDASLSAVGQRQPALRSAPSPYPDCPSCDEPSWNGIYCLHCGHGSDELEQNSFVRSLLQKRAERRATA